MANGFTFNGVAGRIREVEHKIGGSWYVSVCWLAMCRDSGKGAKKRLEDKVFGTNKPKITSTFRNAWRIAAKSFPEGFHADCRKAVVELGLDEAIDYAMARLEEHKAALGVTTMADYEENCIYSSKDAMPPAAEPEPEEEQEEQEAAKTLHDTSENTAIDEPERDLLADFAALVSVMGMDELIQAAQLISNRISDLEETEQLKAVGE